MNFDDYQQEIQYLKQRLSFDGDQRDFQIDEKFLLELEENFVEINDRLDSLNSRAVLQIPKSFLKVNERRNFVEIAENVDESSRLIGVANIYLIGLFSCSKVDYTVPIINIDGKISGSLHVALDHVGSLSIERPRDYHINSMTSITEIDRTSLDEGIEDTRSLFNEKNDQITIKFTLKEIRDVDVDSDEPLICHYSFINPKLDQTIITSSYNSKTKIFSFDSEQNNEFTFQITDSFLEKCLNNAISVEICRSTMIPRPISSESTSPLDRLVQSWRDVKRHVQFSIEIQELNSTGQWIPVEIDCVPGILTGGVYRLKQGQTKRLVIQLRLLPQPSTLPLIIDNIQTVQIGSIHRRRIDAPIQLDSYDDQHLNDLRSQWYRLIDEEKSSLEDEMQQLHVQHSYHSIERQSQILHQLVQLAEERNLLEFPPIRSGLPGSPASWIPPPSIEMHRPILFFSSNVDLKDLMEEYRNDMLTLPIIHHSTETSVIAQWNPSIHDAIVINQCTPHDSIIYLIVRITVTISEPIRKELIFRKRIAVTISKGETWWNVKALKSWINTKSSTKTSVVYELISEIPKNIHGEQMKSENLLLDDVQRLARIASKVDALILVDRLRQEVLLSEKCPLIRQSLQHRHRTLSSSSLSSIEHDLTIGDRVLVNTGHQITNELGRIRYIGDFHLHQGIWYGIELDHPLGKHSGKLDGRIYFQCQDQHGLFVRREKLSRWR